MSRSPWASTKSLVGLFATSALGISRCAAPARAGSARGRHSTPSTTAPKPGSKGAPDTGAVVLGPWIGCSSQEGAARVRALQVLLAGAGCPPGPIDGLYGPLTEQAVVGHPGPALPHAVHRQRARTTLPTNARIHSSSSPFAVIGRLVGMAAVLLLATMAFSGRRRGRRSAPGDARTPVEPKGLIEAPKTDGLEIAEDAQGPNAGREADHTPVSGEADLTFRRVLALEEAGHLTEAVAAYRRADEFGHATAPSNLGVLLEQHGGRGGAETFYLRAHQRGNADLAFNLALPLAEQDNQMGALEAYKRADLPGHRTAAANLGVLAGEQGELAAAESCSPRADDRGDAHGTFNLAVLLAHWSDESGGLEAVRRTGPLGNDAIAERACGGAREVTSKAAAVKAGGNDGP